MDLGLKDRICLVTGSTAGIGLETARALAAEGARVVDGRDVDRAEHAKVESGAALALACDLAEPGAAEKLVAETAEALGPVECLVNNVAEAYQVGFEELTDQQWDAMWQLNVMSYVRCIRAVLPGDEGGRSGDDRQRLVDRREAAVDRDAELLRDQGGGALALPARGRSLRQARHPLQRRHARPDGDRRRGSAKAVWQTSRRRLL